MLYEISRRVAIELAAKKVPFPVVYGPERTESTTFAHERIVLERFGNDSVGAPHSQTRNPKRRFDRMCGARLVVFAKSPLSGATQHDHEDRADLIVDRVLVALDTTIRSIPSLWTVGGGRFAPPQDLVDSEVWSGARYELEFQYWRGVEDRVWPTVAAPEGAARDEATVTEGFITSTTKVRLVTGDPEAPPETGCGG